VEKPHPQVGNPITVLLGCLGWGRKCGWKDEKGFRDRAREAI